MQNELIYSLHEIEKAVQFVLEKLSNSKVVALHADMGSGKTTLVSAFMYYLESADVIGSPTFSIINEYRTGAGKTVYHMDWYRLKDEEEAIAAGVEDALYSGNLCLVEWPDRAADLLPDDTLHLQIETIDEQTRKLSFSQA